MNYPTGGFLDPRSDRWRAFAILTGLALVGLFAVLMVEFATAFIAGFVASGFAVVWYCEPRA